jgi:hypothetical protein
MSDTLTDQQHDWATRFCDVDTRETSRASAPGGGPGGPKNGKVIRVEHDPGKFNRKPPGKGAYSESEYADWISHHPHKKDESFALVTGEDHKRIVTPASTPRALWGRRFYYAKMAEDKDIGATWEVWCNDDGDGAEVDVYVKVDPP